MDADDTDTAKDALTRELTCFKSFAAMLEPGGSYYPTLRADLDRRATILADWYDEAQGARGDSRRAYRG